MTTTFATPPAKTLSFVLLNRDEGQEVTDFLPKLADAINEGLTIFSQFHGGSYICRAGSSPTDRRDGEIAVNIRKAVTTDPSGALGWHQVTNGIPDIELPYDTMSGLTGDSNALDTVASHEVFETCGDPGANGLKDNGNGKVSAEEECDRVEDVTFPVSNGLNLSNFLLASAWIPGAPGPYDYCSALSAQLDASNQVTMTPGGYDIEGDSPNLTDVTPEAKTVNLRVRAAKPFEDGRARRKADKHSRTSRRLAGGLKVTKEMAPSTPPTEPAPAPVP
jgi:hypothetical protein